jgi:hypothetical protein
MRTKLTITLMLLVLLLPLAAGLQYLTQLDITQVPFNTTSVINLTAGENDVLRLICMQNASALEGACLYATPENYTLANITNISFSISLPNLTSGQYSEQFLMTLNGTLIDNFSIKFLYNISLLVPTPEINITILNISPENGTYFSQFDTIPTFIEVKYFGYINFTESNLEVTSNGTKIETLLAKTTGAFRLHLLNISSEGIIEGKWTFIDNNGQQLPYYYTFEMHRAMPSKPVSVSPSRGKYSTGTIDLEVTMESDNYSIYYMIYDGLPPTGNKNWKKLIYTDGIFEYAGINMATAPVGSIYLKIVDRFGNIRIYPTGIISSERFNIDIDERSKSVEPGTEISLSLSFDLKQGASDTMQCKMSNFKSKTTISNWDVRNTVKLSNPDDDEDYIFILPAYDDPITIPDDTSFERNLLIFVPVNINAGEDYTSKLLCRYS